MPYKIRTYDSCLSTMDKARELLGREDLVQVVACLEQTQGRGKPGRMWESLKGNLFATLILPFNATPSSIGQISFLTAVALGRTFLALDQTLEIQYKWPNDVLIKSKKISGILLEQEEREGQNFILIGMGVNLTAYSSKLNATCLKEYGVEQEPLTLLSSFLPVFYLLWEEWKKNGFKKIREEWLQRAWKHKERIEIYTNLKTYTGIFEGLDQDGGLIVKGDDGMKYRLCSGDVF